MTARPVAHAPNDRLLILLLMLGIGGVIWALHMPTGSTEPSASPSMALNEVTRVVTVTETNTPSWTQTARVVVQTPTGTETPLIPFCQNAMRAGDLCVQEAVPRTATSYPECPKQRTYELICRKAFDGTESEGATE